MRAPLRALDLSDAGLVLTEHGCAYGRTVEDAFAARGARLRVPLEMGSSADGENLLSGDCHVNLLYPEPKIGRTARVP